ncbi:hypothetical protein [Azospirillum sp. TSO22-1]|uniref:hypothetical protein n=1 Tax=Azospirillum sp. TSO22-1 TaxID=716789 RepID=UPI000D613875|nr:hypothetical protein [Azospirillum sp. TSO22-1]PWC52313.1 hypothetical protein TSO221_14710 [Azospirillum sp. TSO22-1]
MVAAFVCAIGCGGAWADSIRGLLPVGAVHEGQVPLGRATVPLPPGKWTVTAFKETRSDHNNVISEVTLSSIQNGRYQGFVSIRTNQDPARNGWQPYAFCSRKDVYFIQLDANYKHEEACWGINHQRMEETSKYRPDEGRNSRQVVADAGLAMPKTMIATHMRVASSGWFVTYDIFLNPTYFGFGDEGANWASNPWHKDLIARDPRKVNFMEQLRSRHAPIYAALRSTFQ